MHAKTLKAYNPRITAALESILNYLEEDEKQHYNDCDEKRGHIYIDVVVLRNWLENE